MSEIDDAIDQIESHAALYRELRLRAEIERLRTQLRQIELNSREGEPLTLKLNWLARRALEGAGAPKEEND